MENVDVRDKMLKEGSKQAAIYFLHQLSNPMGYLCLALMRNYVGNSHMYYLVSVHVGVSNNKKKVTKMSFKYFKKTAVTICLRTRS